MTQILRRLFRHSRTAKLKALRMTMRILTPLALVATLYLALVAPMADHLLFAALCALAFVVTMLVWAGVSGELKSRRRPF